MTEQERKAMQEKLDELNSKLSSGQITVNEAGVEILAKAKEIKELYAYEIKGERGMKGYSSFCESVQKSTYHAMHKLFFPEGLDPSDTMIKLHEEGQTKEEIIQGIISRDKNGSFAGREAFLNDTFDYILWAHKYDNEHLAASRSLASETIKNDKVAEPDLAKFKANLENCGIAFADEPAQNREKESHELVTEKAVSSIQDIYRVPRWAKCLMKRPGITEEEKKNIETLWNRDRNGQREVFEMFFSAIEHVDPACLDVKNLDEYTRNIKTYDYIGVLAFDREMALGDFESNGFTMSVYRRSDLAAVSRCISDIQNKFSKGLNIMEHPRLKYIKNLDDVTSEKAAMLLAMSSSEPNDPNNQAEQNDRRDAIYFANELLTYAGNKVPDPTRAKEIIAYNKEYTGEERTAVVKEWYEQFKKVMEAEGIDLNDPVAMGRIKAQVPEKADALYLPACKSLDEESNIIGKPILADVSWYAENLNSANDLTVEQMSNLYELSRSGKLALMGKDMTEESMRIVYNNKAGVPQLSRPVVEVNAGGVYQDEEALAKELFPDATHPFRVYIEVCNLHAVTRNQISLTEDENGGLDFASDDVVRVAYDRTLLRDYYEHPDKYNDPQAAKDRAAQVYTVCKYTYGNDEAFNQQYEEYMEENDITFESDEPVLSDQEKAIASLNNYRLNSISVPMVTKEMVDFVNSIAPVLEENGWNMSRLSDKASLRMFTEDSGRITEIPAYAPLKFTRAGSKYMYQGVEDKLKDSRLSPEERFLLSNSEALGCSTNVAVINSAGTTAERIRIALIYEMAKNGHLLITRPGEPTSTAIPIIPGEDGKAKLVSDFDTLSDAERKSDYYINANRIRRLYKNPEEKARMACIKENKTKLDRSNYYYTLSNMDKVGEGLSKQARAKGINSKAEFIRQAMALTPQVNVGVNEFLQVCNEDLINSGEEPLKFKPNKIKAKQLAARKEISRIARENFFDAKYELTNDVRFANEAVKRGVVTEEEAHKFLASRGMSAIFFDRSESAETMEANIEALRIMSRGSTEEKTALYNRRLAGFANFDTAGLYDISDMELAERWPELDNNMFRLQELISINKHMNAMGVHGDATLLKNAMDAERYSGDLYFYLSNRLQAIANPLYETVDMNQLLSLDYDTSNTLAATRGFDGSREMGRFITNISTARQGIELAGANHISCQFIDRFGATDKNVSFYDKDGNTLENLQVSDQLMKGNVVFAAHKGEDQVYAFKSEKGSFKGDLQPSNAYAKKINSLTELRKELRLDAEEKAMERDFAKFKKEVEANERRIEALRAERAARKNETAEYDGEALDALFDGYPEERAVEKVKEKPIPPAMTESEAIREKAREIIREEMEYQQYKLGLIIESYGPNGAFRNKVDDYKAFSRGCVAEILALSRVLEQSEKDGISKAELEKLGTKEYIGSVKAAMLEEEGCKMTLEALDTEKLTAIAAFDKESPDKAVAAQEVFSSYKNNVARIKADREEMFKAQARDVMRSGIDKYKEFSNKLDDVIDYGQYKLAAAGRSIEANIPGSKESGRACLAEVFAAITVKDIIDNKNMTYKQAEGLSSLSSLKQASKDILRDPAFNQFYEKLSKTPNIMVEVGKQAEDESFSRDLIGGMLNTYKDMRAEMNKQREREAAKSNPHIEQPRLV
ncbi:MAG: hypothetical protein MJ194_05140 [Clostridia bacterium]|nr:hypothetical protein [Clostridia bacterium]